MRSGRGHRVNNGRHDLGAAQAKIRYRLRSARRITRFPARFHAGVSAACGRRFQSQVACTLSAPHSDERTSDGPGARSARGYSVAPVRCNFLPQARDIIVNRPTGLCNCARRAARPCTVRRSGCYGIGRTDRHVSLACHSMCRPVPVSIGRNLKAGPRV